MTFSVLLHDFASQANVSITINQKNLIKNIIFAVLFKKVKEKASIAFYKQYWAFIYRSASADPSPLSCVYTIAVNRNFIEKPI